MIAELTFHWSVQAIQVHGTENNGFWYINLSALKNEIRYGHGECRIIVNEEDVTHETEISVTSPILVRVDFLHSVIVKYVATVEGFPDLSPQEHDTHFQQLLSKASEVDLEAGHYVFPNIEDEIRLGQFVRNYHPVTEKRVRNTEPVIVTYVERPTIRRWWMTPLRQVTGSFGDILVRYNRFDRVKANLYYLKESQPGQDAGFDFSAYNSGEVFLRYRGQNAFKETITPRTFTGTHKECQELYNQDTLLVERLEKTGLLTQSASALRDIDLFLALKNARLQAETLRQNYIKKRGISHITKLLSELDTAMDMMLVAEEG